jgi:hypothetical protein
MPDANWYQTLFESSPISLWVEDFSSVRAYLDRLRADGVSDLVGHLTAHPEVVAKCATLARVVDVNAATTALFAARSKQELMVRLAEIFDERSFDGFLHNLLAIVRGETTSEVQTVNRTLSGQRLDVIVRWAVLPGHEQTLERVVVSIVNITGQKRIEAERERLIAELQQALSRIKKLSGLIPICASCKKIRDDSGYWHQVEAYIRDHSEAQFTHGLCPICAEKLYPNGVRQKP